MGVNYEKTSISKIFSSAKIFKMLLIVEQTSRPPTKGHNSL